MFVNLRLAENAALIVTCAIIALLAIVFFIVIYAVDFKDSRKRAKNKRTYKRVMGRVERRKQNPADDRVLSRDS